VTISRPDAGYARWDGRSELSLAQGLGPSTVFCAEAGASGRFVSRQQRPRADRTLGLVVTARSVFGYPIAGLFAAALEQRLLLCTAQKELIHTALHEALGNAVLHGNLGVGSHLADSPMGLDAMRGLIDSRLACDELGLSSIRLDASWTSTALYVAVRDSGRGFRPPRVHRPPDEASHSGRGLFILQAFCDRIRHFAGGTGVMLGFAL
jgi:anti-sigma regulatory factor (Ser/Thr protein kinase)